MPSFEIISIGANKELQLQNDLAAMIKKWDDVKFPICTYKDTEIKILASLDDIQVGFNMLFESKIFLIYYI